MVGWGKERERQVEFVLDANLEQDLALSVG